MEEKTKIIISVMQVGLCKCALDALTQQRERGLPLTPSNKLHPITEQRSRALSGRDQSQISVNPNELTDWLILCPSVCLTIFLNGEIKLIVLRWIKTMHVVEMFSLCSGIVCIPQARIKTFYKMHKKTE